MKNLSKYRIIGYAESFLAFLFSDSELWKGDIVKQIILFGSAARGEITELSDIDLFLEVYDLKQNELVHKQVEQALGEFAGSRTAKEWELRGVSNEIVIQTGKLDKMSDLKRSIISDGIVLYSKYSADVEAEHYALISFDSIKEKSRRYRVERYLFGRKEADLSYEGIVKRLGGRRLSNRVFVLPTKQAPEMAKHLRMEKVNFTLHEIWSDTL